MPNPFFLLLALSGLGALQAAPETPLGVAPGRTAEAQPGTEYIVAMPLAGLVPHNENRGAVQQTDWLPPGLSVDRATRMVTIERMSGGAGPDAPMRMLRGLATCLGDCPGQAPNPIDLTPLQGHPAARVRIDIPLRRTTGLPSSLYALAVSGDRDVHLVLVVVPGPPSPADERFAREVLDSVVLCTPGSGAAACRAH